MQRRATLAFVSVLMAVMMALGGCAGGGTIPSDAEQALPGASSAKAEFGAPGEARPPSAGHKEGTLTEPTESGETTGGEAPLSHPVDKSGINTQTEGLLQVHFIHVGQGASQLLIGPTGKTMLIDGGNNHMEEEIVAYLRDQGIGKVDILIGTHPDADHIGGLDAVVDHFDIGKIYMPRVQSNTKTFESLLLSIQQKGLKVTTAKAGLTLDWEQGAEVIMIAPAGEYEDTNEMSAVVHVTFGETSFLFTGDAGTKSEADMIASGANLKADVLLVGHHGSATSTGEAFLEKVSPAYAVIQVGKNSYGHPTEAVLNRLSDRGVRIFRTDEQGHIVFVSDGKTLKAEQNPWTFDSGKPTEEQPAGAGQDYEPVSEPEPKPASETEPVSKTESSGQLTVTAEIDNEHPAQNGKVTVTVKVTDEKGHPISGANVRLLLHYKSTKTEYEGTTDGSGISELSFRIGRATKGYTVKGDITVTAGDGSGKADIQFTPE